MLPPVVTVKLARIIIIIIVIVILSNNMNTVRSVLALSVLPGNLITNCLLF